MSKTKAKMVKYPKTGDYYSFIKNISHRCRFDGLDENGDAIYNNDPLPTLNVNFTTKLHGSNAAISLQDGKIVCLSRNRVLGKQGHFGFPELIYANEDVCIHLFEQTRGISDWKPGEIITIYGEIAGPGIQKGVSISEIPEKTWFIFAAKITNTDNPEDEGRWVKGIDKLGVSHPRIKNIHEFKTWNVDIDVSSPKIVQNELNALALSVGDECPVAAQMGVQGVGEGVVGTCFYEGERFAFKIKDGRHSKSKIKKMADVDPIVLKNIQEFVAYSCTVARMDQAIFEVGQEIDDIYDKRNTGKVVNWIKSDILSECSRELSDNKLEFKQVAKDIGDKMRGHFFQKILENV